MATKKQQKVQVEKPKELEIAYWANHEPPKRKRNYKPLLFIILIIVVAYISFMCGQVYAIS